MDPKLQILIHFLGIGSGSAGALRLNFTNPARQLQFPFLSKFGLRFAELKFPQTGVVVGKRES